MFNAFVSKRKPPSKSHSSSTLKDPDTYLSKFTIKKKIGSAKFSVYLAVNKVDHNQYALKAYPYTEDGINERYKRESRFFDFSHPHICKIVHAIPEKPAMHGSEVKKYSFLMLEYAPYGDFFELFKEKKAMLSEKLARTYFRQLIEGIEYLHKQNIAHLDIKCENLLIGENFKMKITDFDLSQYLDEAKLESRGTLCYRAPEVIETTCTDFAKADIYSAGIILFVLKSGGVPPHLEEEDYQGINLYRLLYQDKKRYWEVQESFQGKPKFFSESFKKLFHMMTEKDPNKRATIDRIKRSDWYNEPVLTYDQLKSEMKHFYMV